jgi:hypothetical protein
MAVKDRLEKNMALLEPERIQEQNKQAMAKAHRMLDAFRAAEECEREIVESEPRLQSNN